MIEIHVTHEDGRRMCHELGPGDVYSVIGDEVEIAIPLDDSILDASELE
tara:strand:- start:39 stop:185 length:147 start_codon:yes stop_codon:yes gene_type:complete